ncbi:MAG: DUF2490 domain-containing protein [Gemmatimonadaceae bacterium]|nr:DUF2490 domain-containing protein [Gemmatimonadaceae bacterium]
MTNLRTTCAVTTCLLLAALPLRGQQVADFVLWGGLFGDHRFGARSSLYWDYHPRRADGGRVWQLNLGALGYTRDLSKQWRAMAGLGVSHGYRYGEFPARTNTFELRPLVQLMGTRRVGAWTWSDRSRAEFRVIRATGDLAPEGADWNPTVVRLRRQDRLLHNLTQDGRWYGAFSQEFLVNVHPARARVAMLEQTRTQVVVGHALTPTNRVELGYGLQRLNRTGGFEMNHGLLLYYRTTTPFR